MDLNELAFQKIKELKPNKNNTISFQKIRSKICTHFSIKKRDCWKLLMDFKNEGRIEIVRYKGIRVVDK